MYYKVEILDPHNGVFENIEHFNWAQANNHVKNHLAWRLQGLQHVDIYVNDVDDEVAVIDAIRTYIKDLDMSVCLWHRGEYGNTPCWLQYRDCQLNAV